MKYKIACIIEECREMVVPKPCGQNVVVECANGHYEKLRFGREVFGLMPEVKVSASGPEIERKTQWTKLLGVDRVRVE